MNALFAEKCHFPEHTKLSQCCKSFFTFLFKSILFNVSELQLRLAYFWNSLTFSNLKNICTQVLLYILSEHENCTCHNVKPCQCAQQAWQLLQQKGLAVGGARGLGNRWGERAWQ